jgi:hypothetical protein
MFSKVSDNDPDRLICRFNPPTQGGWGYTEEDWWCGRFKPVDNLTAIEWVAWQKGLEENAKA